MENCKRGFKFLLNRNVLVYGDLSGLANAFATFYAIVNAKRSDNIGRFCTLVGDPMA